MFTKYYFIGIVSRYDKDSPSVNADAWDTGRQYKLHLTFAPLGKDGC